MTNLTTETKRQATKARPKIEVKVEFEADAKGVKQFLKLHSYNPKDFKVRKSYGGYSKSLYITIKNIEISKKEVECLVNSQFSKVSYCEITQEILAGGNTFVFVEYDEDTFDELVESKKTEAEQLYKELKTLPDWGELCIEHKGYKLYLSNNRGSFPTYTIHSTEANYHCSNRIYSAKDIAYALATLEAH